MNYQPAVWRIIELGLPEERHCRVLAGWYGGYTESDSWKLSSGITQIIDKDTYYEIHNHSGSIYECYKTSHKFSRYTYEIYKDMCAKAKTIDVEVKLLEEADVPSKVILTPLTSGCT